MMNLNKADEKIWNRICSSPYWEEHLRHTLRERLLDRQTHAVMNRSVPVHEVWRQMHPNIADDALREMIYDLGRFLDAQDLRTGIARRVWLDDPAELAQFLAYSARAHWLREGHFHGPNTIPGCYVLEAIAIGDWAFVQRSLDTSRFPLRQGNNWQRIGAFAVEESAGSDAFLGYLHGKLEDAEKAMRWLEARKTEVGQQATRECLWGLIQNDSQRFLAGLTAIRDSTRKVRGTTDPEYRLISLTLHGYFELALKRHPSWVAGWDVEQQLPWDSGFYHWRRGEKPALTEEHLVGLDPDSISYILNLPRPKWSDSLQTVRV
jgi:hypothetical protein